LEAAASASESRSGFPNDPAEFVAYKYAARIKKEADFIKGLQARDLEADIPFDFLRPFLAYEGLQGQHMHEVRWFLGTIFTEVDLRVEEVNPPPGIKTNARDYRIVSICLSEKVGSVSLEKYLVSFDNAWALMEKMPVLSYNVSGSANDMAEVRALSFSIKLTGKQIENPQEWTRELIVERAKSLVVEKGPQGDFDD